ncbi:MAG: HlyD family efflux transporter periplasmic adaptor subunit [Phycisphaeraceae bacterium]|nr:HlyD family efflux transporter periplasmic adaptor subunit [Phycisphaeraceae bacterium]
MKKFSPKTIALLVRTLVGLLLLISAGSLMAYLIATKPQVSKSDLAEQSVAVQVMRIEPVEVARQWRGYGTTQAKDKADVPARVGATVVTLPDGIEVGRVVRAGQTLAELDSTDFSNALNAAEKRIAEAEAVLEQLTTEQASLKKSLAVEKQDYELARADYERQVERRNSGAATASDVDRAQRTLLNTERAVIATQNQLDVIPPRRLGIEAQQAAATADRDTAKANLARTTITSPIDGIIEMLDIEVGENLAPGQRVARIIDPRVIELPLQLPASARSYVATGNSVTITTRSHPDDCPPWNATITRLGIADSPTRTITAFAEVDQSRIPLRNFAEGTGPYKLSAGAFTLARLDTADPQQQTIVPARSIQEGRIRTVVDGQVVGRTVDVAFDLEGAYPQYGTEDTQWVVLKEPLEPGTLVVLSASMTILDGQRVEAKVTNDSATTATTTGVSP